MPTMRIVVNPGHGKDPGAVTSSGLKEAEVVQDVVKRLCALGPYEPKRQGNALIDLLSALWRNKPDVLLSVHCNSPSKHLHRCEAFVWREEPDRAILAESDRLARLICKEAIGSFAETAQVSYFPIMRDNGTGRPRPLTPGIVKGTATRAIVLVELGYMSDPHVEAAMRTEAWRQRAAEALDRALRAWVMGIG